jgi:hypothetical protein
MLVACVSEPDVIGPGESLPPVVLGTTPAPKPWLNVPVPVGEEDCELRLLERMLNANCGMCHSMPYFHPCIDCLGYALYGEPLRISTLMEYDRIVPGDADASRMLIRIYRGDMPPPVSGLPPMPEADVAWLASFIDTLEPGEEPSCSATDAR